MNRYYVRIDTDDDYWDWPTGIDAPTAARAITQALKRAVDLPDEKQALTILVRKMRRRNHHDS